MNIRTVHQLPTDEKDRFPIGATCLVEKTYVVDTFHGVENLDIGF